MAQRENPNTLVDRRASQIKNELDSRTTRLAQELGSELTGGDSASISTSDYHAMIRRNWADPNFRSKQAARVGPVAFYKSALQAFGVNQDGTVSQNQSLTAPTNLQDPSTFGSPAPGAPADATPPPSVPLTSDVEGVGPNPAGDQ